MKFSFIFFFFLNFVFSYGQTNLVPNPGFEIVEKKIKTGGQIELATGWKSPGDKKADLFSKKSKNPAFACPNNSFGIEMPDQEDNYAGIIIYSDRNRVPRTYLQTKLTTPLLAGKEYCFKFYISLADGAKYATNSIAGYFSNQAIGIEELKKHTIIPQIIHTSENVFDLQSTWTQVCKKYTAKGGEKFITIGNFAKTIDTKAVRVKRPRWFTKPQKPISYYFIETVSVIATDEIEKWECQCEVEEKEQTTKTVKHTTNGNKDGLEEIKKINSKKVFFEANKTVLKIRSKATLNEVVAIMKKYPSFKIEIHGFKSAVETNIQLSEKRVKSILKTLITLGISKERIVSINKGTGPKILSNPLNQSVEFKISK